MEYGTVFAIQREGCVKEFVAGDVTRHDDLLSEDADESQKGSIKPTTQCHTFIFSREHEVLIDALSPLRIFRLKATNEDTDLYSDGRIFLLPAKSRTEPCRTSSGAVVSGRETREGTPINYQHVGTSHV